MVPILAVAFIVVPLAELAVLIAVGDRIGLVPTLILLLVVSVVGAWLAKREGLAAWRRLQLALAPGRCCSPPASSRTSSGFCCCCPRPGRSRAGSCRAWPSGACAGADGGSWS